MLNKATGEKVFTNSKRVQGFTGLYFKDNINFFAIYPSEIGPKIFYRGKEYRTNNKLSISLEKHEKNRKIRIVDYNIEIDYQESPYIGFDEWSDEIDVDLFYLIEQRYKKDEFYE